MRNAYLETLYELAAKDKNVYAVISDNGAIVYDKYRRDFPEQFINAGIAEANMIGMSAGLAERGKIPFAYTIGSFLAYRAFEFVLNDVCLQNMNVKMVGIGAGFSYSLLGASHHTIFDISLLRGLPNLTIFSPASPLEVKKIVKAAYEIDGPVYIRLGTNGEKEIHSGDFEFRVGKGMLLRYGKDICIISTGSVGSDALEVAEMLKKSGIECAVANIHTLKPLDAELVRNIGKKYPFVVTLEEHSIYGGLGSMVAEIFAESSCQARLKRFGIENGLVKGYGRHDEIQQVNGLDIDSITKKIMGALL